MGDDRTRKAPKPQPTYHELLERIAQLEQKEAAHLVAERELRESEERLRAHIDNSPMAVVEFDPQFRVTRWSQQAERLFGWSAEEILGRAIQEMRWVHDDDVESVRQESAGLLSGERPRSVNVNRNYRKDGSIVYCEWYDSALYDAQGRLVSILALVLDVSERKRAESVLQTTLQRFYAVLSNMYSAVLLVTADGRVEFANSALCSQFGLKDPPANLVGLSAPEMIEKIKEAYLHPAEAVARIAEVVDRGRPVRAEELAMRDGATCLRDFVPLNLGGESLGRLWLHFDITERKRAEEALRHAEAEAARRAAELESLFDTIDFPVMAFDAVGRVTRVNAAAQDLLGTDPTGFDAGTWQKLIMQGLAAKHADGRSGTASDLPVHRALQGETVKDMVGRLQRDDGVEVVVEASSRPVRQNDRVVGAVTVLHDITERIRAEQALHDANDRLTEADRRKDEFLGMLSHELRSPLMPIRNSLYLLEHAGQGGEQARHAQAVIGRQVGHLTQLVDDLLDITRIGRGKIRLQRGRIDLTDLVARTVGDHDSAFGDQEIDLQLRPWGEPLFVNGDPTRLAQVVGNLLQNALKFTSQGGRTLVTVSEDGERHHAVVRVSDTGAGIPPEALRRLFEPFMQADHTLDRSRGGLGLGLALVKGFVELHGGEVTADSEGLGKGAEFTVRLPLDRGPVAGVAVRASSALTGNRRRVLIIEDNVDAADSLCLLLEMSGHEVAVAHSGPEGIEMARNFHPQVVLCDIGLPGMDGYAVARAFRCDEILGGALLVALSGYALPEDVAKAIEAGFDRHLAKPPSEEQIRELLALGSNSAPD